MNDTLLDRAHDAYWGLDAKVESKSRVKAVLTLVSDEIRSWAPAVDQARICNLAINEVADRIIKECEA